MYVHWGLILGNKIPQRGLSLKFFEGKRHHDVHLGFPSPVKVDSVLLSQFSSLWQLGGGGGHNALLEYGAFEPIHCSEFPPLSLLPQESFSFASVSHYRETSHSHKENEDACTSSGKVQMIWLRLECFSHSWCQCFRSPDIFISAAYILPVIYPAQLMQLLGCLHCLLVW